VPFFTILIVLLISFISSISTAISDFIPQSALKEIKTLYIFHEIIMIKLNQENLLVFPYMYAPKSLIRELRINGTRHSTVL
jgi:hypothetical protein